VSATTSSGIPDINPADVISNPEGSVPLNNEYDMLVAGSWAEADNCTAIGIKAG